MEDSLSKLLSGQKSFEEEVFEGLDLNKTQLLDFNFEECEFQSCQFNNINLYGSKLQNVIFNDCKFVGVDFSVISKFLTEMKFNNCVLEICTFRELKLTDIGFSKTALKECDFDSCNLQKVSFHETELPGTSFINCDLRNANFNSATNYFFDLNQNKVKGAVFSHPEVLSFLSPFGLKIN
jgi:fluoroquinolone resistance protein